MNHVFTVIFMGLVAIINNQTIPRGNQPDDYFVALMKADHHHPVLRVLKSKATLDGKPKDISDPNAAEYIIDLSGENLQIVQSGKVIRDSSMDSLPSLSCSTGGTKLKDEVGKRAHGGVTAWVEFESGKLVAPPQQMFGGDYGGCFTCPPESVLLEIATTDDAVVIESTNNKWKISVSSDAAVTVDNYADKDAKPGHWPFKDLVDDAKPGNVVPIQAGCPRISSPIKAPAAKSTPSRLKTSAVATTAAAHRKTLPARAHKKAPIPPDNPVECVPQGWP